MTSVEKARARQARYRETHRGQRRESWRQYRLKKLADDPEWDKKRCQADADKRAVRAKVYRKEHLSHSRTVNAEWKKQNPERWRIANNARNARWNEKRPDRRREIRIANDAKRRAAPGRLSYGAIPRLKRAQGNQCPLCTTALGPYHVDHIIPLSRGGHHVDENIQLLCPPCNLRKSNKLPHEMVA